MSGETVLFLSSAGRGRDGMCVASTEAIPFCSLVQSGGGGRVKKLRNGQPRSAAQIGKRLTSCAICRDNCPAKKCAIVRGKIRANLAQLQLNSMLMVDDPAPPLGKHGGARVGAGRPKRGEKREQKIQGGRQNNESTLKSGEKNTKTHWLRRLDRDHPGLAARVRAGELTANAAATELGWRRPPTRSQGSRKRFDAAALIG